MEQQGKIKNIRLSKSGDVVIDFEHGAYLRNNTVECILLYRIIQLLEEKKEQNE